jgi:hypothetical protein
MWAGFPPIQLRQDKPVRKCIRNFQFSINLTLLRYAKAITHPKIGMTN